MSSTVDSLEFQLALSCSALDKSWATDVVAKIQESDQFDENKFILLVRRHHIAELAFQTLEGNSFFSDSFHLQLRDLVTLNQTKSIKGLSIFIQLQQYFKSVEIEPIYLKGLFISHLYYGDIGIRNLVDLDIWVPEHRFSEARMFLLTLGYSSIWSKDNWNQKQLHYLHLCNHDEIFIHQTDKNAPVVELHWKLRNSLGNFMFNPVEDKSSLSYVDLNGFQFAVFNHVDQFIFLSVHGAEHGWFKIKWLVDLYHILKKVEFDWNELYKRAFYLNAVKEVRLGLILLKTMYGLEFSNTALSKKAKMVENLRVKYILHLLQYNGSFCDTPKEKMLNVIYLLSLNRRRFLAKELLLKNLTNTTDWLTLRLPQRLFFLYFPLRPILWVYRKFKS